jgi:hypothetical protein
VGSPGPDACHQTGRAATDDDDIAGIMRKHGPRCQNGSSRRTQASRRPRAASRQRLTAVGVSVTVAGHD